MNTKSEIVPRRGPVAALCAGLSIVCLASGAGAQLVSFEPEFSRPDPDNPGAVLSPLENPLLVGEVILGGSPSGTMLAEVGPQVLNWAYQRFGVWGEIRCAAGDTLCVRNAGFKALLAAPPPDPAILGGFSWHDGTVMPFEIPNIQLGYGISDATFHWEVDQGLAPGGGDNAPLQAELGRVRVRLDPSTLVVPVNVAVVLPGANLPNQRAFMEPYADRRVHEALFDNQWSATTLRGPDGPIENLGLWDVRTRRKDGAAVGSLVPGLNQVETVTGSEGEFFGRVNEVLGVRPDDVFAQCGIQFRMQEFAVIEETDPEYVRRVKIAPNPQDSITHCEGGGPLGGGSLGLLLRHMGEKARAAFTQPAPIQVIFTYRTTAPGCAVGSEEQSLCCSDVAYGAEDSGTVLVGLENIAAHSSTFHKGLVLSHEIGHALGLADIPSRDDTPHLMANTPGDGFSERISTCELRDGQTMSPLPPNCTPGLPAIAGATCDLARRGAGGTPSDTTVAVVDAGPDQTVECTSPAGATVTLSGTASDPETGITSQRWTDEFNMLLGETPVVTVQAPLGRSTTYRFTATNGAGLFGGDAVLVTVRDTVPPAFIGEVAVTAMGCDAAGAVSVPAPSVSDLCTEGAIAPVGAVIESGGIPLAVPLPVQGGAVAVEPGTYVIEWSATDASGNPGTFRQTLQVLPCMAAAQSIALADRSKVTSPTGDLMPIANYGPGPVDLGTDTRSGSIASVGPVTLRDRATVEGSVRTASTLTRFNQTTVTGAIEQGANIVLPAAPSITNSWPANSSGNFHVAPDKSAPLPPGSYASVSVASRAVLVLSEGTYYFDSLTLEPQSTVRLLGPATIEVRSQLTHRGNFRDPSGAVTGVRVRYRGTAPVYLESVFRGSILAPSASLIFGAGSALEFHGQFYGRTLELRPGVTLVSEATPGSAAASGGIPSLVMQAKTSVVVDTETEDDLRDEDVAGAPSGPSSPESDTPEPGVELPAPSCSVGRVHTTGPGALWLAAALVSASVARARRRRRSNAIAPR
jgi:hypothetical protein